MNIVYLIILSGIAGVLYRMGGAKGYNTKFRDWGCPLISIITLYMLGVVSGVGWKLIAALTAHFGLLWAFLTTYNKWFSKLFGYNDNDVHWPSWLITGFFYALSYIPLIWTGVLWYAVLVRAAGLAVVTMMWSEWNDNVVVEECGKGFFLIFTMPVLLW